MMKMFSLILGVAGVLLAADPHAVLRGRVTDSSGAALADVVVVLRTADGLAHRQVTDELGYYGFEGLNSATYSVRIAKPGFRSYEAGDIKVIGTTTLDRQLTSPGPARTVTASDWDKPGPDLREVLREAVRPKWAHVKLVPEFNYSAPPVQTTDPRGRFSYNVSDVAMAAYRESPQLSHVFAPGNPEQRSSIRFRFTF